jgi:hypothetical protein
MRDTMSVPPPGPFGTMILTGRVGHSWAATGVVPATAAKANVASDAAMLRDKIVRDERCDIFMIPPGSLCLVYACFSVRVLMIYVL